jgi:hypothetical protein
MYHLYHWVIKADLVAKLCKENGKSPKTNYRNLKDLIVGKFPTMENFYTKIDFFPPLFGNNILKVIEKKEKNNHLRKASKPCGVFC